MTADSYDDRNVVNAVLTQCRRCRLWWWMTHPKEICVSCR